MSESATLLDEPKVEAGEASAPATTPEAADTATTTDDAASASSPAATNTDEQSIDALLAEATMLAEAAETAEVLETSGDANATQPAETPQVSETDEIMALSEAAIADQPRDSASAAVSTSEQPQNGEESYAEQPMLSGQRAPETAGPTDTTAANPWADEVAQLENQWAQGDEDTEAVAVATPSEQATEAPEVIGTTQPSSETDSTETAPAPVRTRRLVRVMAPVGRMALAGLVLVLVVFDKPFAKLGPALKNFIGYVGIATTIVATACWILAPKVRSMLE